MSTKTLKAFQKKSSLLEQKEIKKIVRLKTSRETELAESACIRSLRVNFTSPTLKPINQTHDEMKTVEPEEIIKMAERAEKIVPYKNIKQNNIENEPKSNKMKDDRIPKFGQEDYLKENVTKRMEWLKNRLNLKIDHLNKYSVNSEDFKGNIENVIGAVQVPVGIAGPILINGEHAKGLFYVPMATTEGVLLTSFTIGMNILNKANGVNVKILRDELHVTSLFNLYGLDNCQNFINWIKENFYLIKESAESTTKHGSLLRIEPILSGNGVLLQFIYDTKDAMGMNMINHATKTACEFIAQKTNINTYHIRSNFSADKKISFYNMHKGYGKEIFASAILTKEHLRLFRITPQELFDFYSKSISSTVRAGMIGFNGQVVNGIAAIFNACGQDIAHVLHSATATSSVSLTDEGHVYISVHIPNLLIGTVGGGTGLPTQRECLEIMDCYGKDKAKKFAEIIGASVLAGELAITASLTNRSFFEAHELLGRNRPK